MTRKPKTAAELMAELRRSPDFVAREKLREAQASQELQAAQQEERNLLSELREVGIFVSSAWDLVNSRQSYPVAIPILVRHLHRPYSPKVREGIVRALTVDHAGSEALHELIKEFCAQSDGSANSLKWVLGNAIATVAGSSDADILINLATDVSHGKARHTIILALPRIVKDKARLRDVLHRLKQDEEVAQFAHRAALDRS